MSTSIEGPDALFLNVESIFDADIGLYFLAFNYERPCSNTLSINWFSYCSKHNSNSYLDSLRSH